MPLLTGPPCGFSQGHLRQWMLDAPKLGRSVMPLYWLCYRHNNQISVVIEPGASLVHARLRSALDGLDEGDFTEGHELPGEADDWATAIAGGSGSAPASSSPWASVCCRRTVDISVQRPQRRAQGRRKGLPATTCQRT